MWPGGQDPLYRAVLAGGVAPRIRVEVWRGGVQLAASTEFIGGQVNATLVSQVARNASVTYPESWFPYSSSDLLAPAGNELRIFRGVDYANGDFKEFPVFRGKIQNAQLSGATVTVTASDRAAEVQERGFSAPQDLPDDTAAIVLFRELITNAVPDAVFGLSDEFAQVGPALTAETDRSSVIDRIATAVGAFWYPLADGSFVMRRYPWNLSSGDPVAILADGDEGTVLDSTPTRDRENVYNQILAIAERSDGSAPAHAIAADTVPSSATFTGGPFGVRFKILRLQYPTDENGCLSAAADYLVRSTAQTIAWDLVIVPDASLELGDVVGLEVREQTGIRQVISSFTIPLDNMSGMTVQCRAQIQAVQQA